MKIVDITQYMMTMKCHYIQSSCIVKHKPKTRNYHPKRLYQILRLYSFSYVYSVSVWLLQANVVLSLVFISNLKITMFNILNHSEHMVLPKAFNKLSVQASAVVFFK